MLRTPFLFLFSCLLVLSVGVVLGRLSVKAPETQGTAGRRSWLADQLRLTPPQRQQMDAIWADAKQKMVKNSDRRHALDDEREKAIAAVLDPKTLEQVETIKDDFRARRAEMNKERERLMHDAEERSRALLDASQQKQWDALAKEREGRSGRSSTQRATPPASQPAATQTNERAERERR